MNIQLHTKNCHDSIISKEFLLLTLIIFIFIVTLSTQSNALSNSGGGTWQYFRDITINNTGTALSDYQIMINLTGATFPVCANASGADLRFKQGGAELSYWIEKWDYVNASALVWINVTSMAAGTTSLLMYYGNPSASSSSDVDATFMKEIEGVAGSWNFDEGSGNIAYDNSGNGNDGAIYGATWVNGRFRKGLNFDGGHNYVNIGDKPGLTNLGQVTVETWIYLRSTDSAGIITKNDGSLNDYGLEYSWGNNLYFAVNYNYAPQGVLLSGGSLSTYVWYHIVGIWNETTVSLYKNGSLIGTTPYSGKSTIDGTKMLAFGRLGSYDGWYLNGVLDEARIYNRALSASEISDLYNNYGYTTTNYPGRVLIRKYALPEPNTSVVLTESDAPIIENIMIYPNIPKVSDTVFISAKVADSDLMWVNFTLTSPNGINVIDNVMGLQNGSTWNSSTITIDQSGLWRYSIVAKDADGNSDIIKGSFMVKTIINGTGL